jgi:hypothetical protein
MDRQTFVSARGFRSRYILIGIGLAIAGVSGPRWIAGTARGQQASGDDAKAAAALEKLGGHVFRDGMQAGEPVIGVDFDETGATDEALALLEMFPRLQHLTLDETRITAPAWPTSSDSVS